jgi:hypothetical protein
VNEPRNLLQNYRLFDVPATKHETRRAAMGRAKRRSMNNEQKKRDAVDQMQPSRTSFVELSQRI